MYPPWHRPLLILGIGICICLINGQNLSRQCGLPDNINKFPEFAQEELKAVWKNYVPGTQCDKELLVTDDILAVLDMFETEIPGTQTVPIASTNTNPAGTSGVSAQAPAPSPVPTPQAIDTNTEEELLSATVRPTIAQTSPPVPTTGLASTSVETPLTTSLEDDDDYADFDHPITPPTRNIPTTTEPTTTTRRIPTTTHSRNFHRQNSIEDNEETYSQIPLHEMRNFLPFLTGADDRTVRAFHDVLNDDDVPSEGRRQELIHVLAVSYLNAEQLEHFNAWSTSRRKKLRAREEQLKGLSFGARDALKKLVLADEVSRDTLVSNFPTDVRRELRRFALRRKAARS
uniref:DDE_Tnp_1_assoc domain-containing protein n=2 Tax=Panagrellus redivivus TaxID=6233 RepID=A0A7E4W7P0_PANRE